MADSTKLLEAIAALAWPIIVGLVLWRLFPVVKNIASSRNFTVKFGNVEVSAQDATDKIQAQLNDLNEKIRTLRSAAPATNLAAAPAPVTANGTVSGFGRILWVDDKPSGNALEVAQLEERGIEVVQARSTAEAMTLLGDRTSFAAVVSDMGRTEGNVYRPKAGVELFQAMTSAAVSLPFLVYTGRRYASAHDTSIRTMGGGGATASPVELFEWIERQIRR